MGSPDGMRNNQREVGEKQHIQTLWFQCYDKEKSLQKKHDMNKSEGLDGRGTLLGK